MKALPTSVEFPSLSGKTFIRTSKICGGGESLRSGGFHPFQGRPSFGLTSKTSWLGVPSKFPSLSGKTFIRTRANQSQRPHSSCRSFHPFQGRPSFGHSCIESSRPCDLIVFPSLSGKTFIRTRLRSVQTDTQTRRSFHPFQGRPSFGRHVYLKIGKRLFESFHPFQGRPSFGLRFHNPPNTKSFHPFQGRPSFGRFPLRKVI